jgi:hypothetical protein
MHRYVGEGGDGLKDYSNILELVLHINTKLKLKQETAVLELQENNKSNHQSNKGKSNIGKSIGLKENLCKKHDSAHEWKDCPENISNKNKPKVEKDMTKGDKHVKKDLYSTQVTDKI